MSAPLAALGLEPPASWRQVPFWSLFRRTKTTNHPDEELLSVYRDYGVVPKSSREDNYNKPSDDLSGYQLVREGCLVTNKMKAWQGSIAISRHQGIVSPAYYVYASTSEEHDQFLHYLLRSEPYIALYRRISKGIRVNQWDLEHEALRTVPVLLPDFDTQKAIADFLDRETARIDQLIEKKERFLQLADERWRSVLDAVITGRDPFHADGMIWTPLARLVQDYRRIMYGIVLPGPDVEEGVPIVKGGDVKPYRLKRDRLCKTTFEIEAKFERARLEAGDLIIAIRGGVGDIEIVPADVAGANITQDVARIAPTKDVDREWLRYALMAPSVFAPLEARTLGAVVRGINIFDLRKVMLPTPTLDLQKRLAALLRLKARDVERLTEKVRRHRALVSEFRAALITAAVTGQIDVTTWGKRGDTDRRLDRIEEEMRA